MNPYDGAGDGCLEVLREATATSEPGEGALHNPASGDDYEASSSVGSSYDFQPPVALAFEGFLQLVTGVTAVGKDVAQSGAERANRGEDLTCPITVHGCRDLPGFFGPRLA